MKFRLPRKTKKYLKKQMLLYPPDKDGNSLVANPETSQKEYNLYKKNNFRNLFNIPKKDKEEFKLKIFSKIEMSDKKLKDAVNYIFAKEYRIPSLIILLKAKKCKIAKRYFYAFVNAYNLTINNNNNYGNICCMAVDSAKKSLQ